MFSLILIITTSFHDLYSQDIRSKPTRQSSLDAFSKGNYEEAYKEFKELLSSYSKDPLYKYYTGVCLVKLNKDPDQAGDLLQQALQSASIKTLPSDAMFYLARAQQMGGKFGEAIESFNMYTDQAGKKTARDYGVPEFLQQSKEKKGQITEQETRSDDPIISEKPEIARPVINPPADIGIISAVENKPTAKKDLPVGYDKILENALDFQFKADSLNALADAQKKQSEKLPDNERNALKSKIYANEQLAASYQKSADRIYNDAQASVNPQFEKPQNKDTLPKTGTIKDYFKPQVRKIVNDSARQQEKYVSRESHKQSDTIKKAVPAVEKSVETFAFFEVLPKPVTDPKEKIQVDPVAPEGLIYRIQIAVFRNPVSPSYFKGITPVYGFRLAGTDKTGYYAGLFRRSPDAARALEKVRAKGFKDAFVVAQSGGKSVSSDRAVIMEKEWGNKPFINGVRTVTQLDTIPPTLSFRVEVIRSVKPLKEDKLEGIRKLAGGRGLDTEILDNGEFVYLIGKFITFESAAEYADLMVRNGYRESIVVAWLGRKEIPVETARQLFDNLK